MTANLSDLYRRRRAGVHGTSPQHVGGRGSAPGGSSSQDPGHEAAIILMLVLVAKEGENVTNHTPALLAST